MKRTTLALLALLMLTGTGYTETVPTKVATGTVPTIDGTLASDEWGDALAVELDPEGEAFLKQDEEALYVGIKVGGDCIPSLALLHEQKVLVLHASASLGTAEYERSGAAWKATRTFAWRCRAGRTSDDERERFLADEGWLATTTGDGRRGEAEYRIERRLLKGELPRLAVVACRLRPMPLTACAWPKTVRDGTRNEDLLFGKTPSLELDPDTWARLDLGPAPSPAERFEAELEKIEAAVEDRPVDAWWRLQALLDEHPDSAVRSARVRALRKRLEKERPVAVELRAHRRLESAVKLARKKLREVEESYPHTRAARVARELLEALAP